MSAWDIYLFTRLDIVVALSIACFVVGLIALIANSLCHFAEAGKVERYRLKLEAYPGDRDYMRWYEEAVKYVVVRGIIFKISIPIFILGLLGVTLVPTSKQAAAIYLLPKIANNEQVQQIPGKTMDLLNGKLDQWLDDMRGKEKK
jgi:hypothetical protein